MSSRRFTRLTNAFSKKLENHKWGCALYFFHYNFFPDSPDVACHASDGSGDYKSRLDFGRNCRFNSITMSTVYINFHSGINESVVNKLMASCAEILAQTPMPDCLYFLFIIRRRPCQRRDNALQFFKGAAMQDCNAQQLLG